MSELATPSWILFLMTHEAHISIFGVIVNIFHIFILTRPEMRTTSTNVIMTGIAISDLYYATYPVWQFAKKTFERLKGCALPDSYTTVVLSWIAASLRDNASRCTPFLGLSLAVIRVLVIKKPLVFDNMTGPMFGLKTALFTVAFSSIISFFYYLRNSVEEWDDWTPEYGGCDPADFPENFTAVQYEYSTSEWGKWNNNLMSRIQIFVDGWVGQILPAVLFPILTILLFLELRKIIANRNKLFSDKAQEKSTLSTRLVTYMTLSFVIATFPLGFLYIKQSILCGLDAVCSIRTTHLTMVCSILFDVNTNTHFLINLFASTQYRGTVKRVLRIRTKQKSAENTVSVTNAMRDNVQN